MKKKLLIGALSLILVAIIAFGSLAYLSDTSSTLTNEFMVAEYDPDNPYEDESEIFNVLLDEEDKNPGAAEDARTTTGNQYERIVPGSVLDKDPTVYNTGKYDEYIRLLVTVSNYSEWNTISTKHSKGAGTAFLPGTEIFSFNGAGGTNSVFTLNTAETAVDTSKNTVTFYYYYDGILKPGGSKVLFDKVSIPTYFDNDDMLAIQDFKINIVAQAFQVDELGQAKDDQGAMYVFKNFWGK